MAFKYHIFIILIFFISGCINNSKQKETLTVSDFPKPINLEESRIKTEQMLNIRNFIVQDSFLVINNSRKDSVIMVFNITNFNLIKTWGEKGEGPEEYGVFTHVIKASSDNFQIADFSRYKLETFGIPNLLQKTITDISYINESGNREIPQNIVTCDGRLFFYNSFFADEVFLKKWYLGKQPVKVHNFDFIKKPTEHSDLYIGNVIANYDKNRIIYSYRYSKRFDLMDIKGKIIKTVQYNSISSTDKTKNRLNIANMEVAYISARAGLDSFYLLFIGHTPNSIEKNNFQVKCFIEEYDWDGKPLRNYQINRFISDFEVVSMKESISFIGIDVTNENPLIMLTSN